MPGGNAATYKRLQRVFLRQCNCTSHATKQHTRLYSGFPCGCALSTAHDTRPTQAAIIQPATRWSAYQRPDTLNRYQTPPPRRTLHRSGQTAYYNKVYKRVQGRALLWIHARQCSISQTMPARRGLDTSHAQRLAVWHRVSGQGGQSGALHPAGQSSNKGAAGGAEPLAAPAASLFGLSPDSQ